jgi:positive regulator of sigma E activity
MPEAVDLMVKLLPSVIESGKICLACRDQSACPDCAFHNIPATSEALKQLNAL